MARMGAPTKYRPEFCAELIAHMSRGFSYESFAGLVGVCDETLHNWEKASPDFLVAKKRGFRACQLFWERLGLAAATGEDILDPKGEVSIKAKSINIVMWIFNMKCRFRETWHDDGKPAAAVGRAVVQLAYARKEKA